MRDPFDRGFPLGIIRLSYFPILNLNYNFGNFFVGPYQIPGEDTQIFRIQKKDALYTILEIACPPNGEEATLALMREVDKDSGGPEFLDFYNNGYAGMKQFGIRMQKRGTGQYRDFVFDYYDGATVTEVLRLQPTGIICSQWLKIQGWGDRIIEFTNGEGVRQGYLGRIISDGNPRFVLYNHNSGLAVELYDDGTLKYSGNIIWHSGNQGGSGISSARPQNRTVGSMFFDTTLNKPIWWNGSNWVDSAGNVV